MEHLLPQLTKAFGCEPADLDKLCLFVSGEIADVTLEELSPAGLPILDPSHRVSTDQTVGVGEEELEEPLVLLLSGVGRFPLCQENFEVDLFPLLGELGQPAFESGDGDPEVVGQLSETVERFQGFSQTKTHVGQYEV